MLTPVAAVMQGNAQLLPAHCLSLTGPLVWTVAPAPVAALCCAAAVAVCFAWTMLCCCRPLVMSLCGAKCCGTTSITQTLQQHSRQLQRWRRHNLAAQFSSWPTAIAV
jgi:hypothetical protein